MPDEFPYDVFLSHSAKDKAVVRRLAERLRADGMKVWFDEWVLKPDDSSERNQSKTEKIEEELELFSFGFRVSDFGFSSPCLSANAFGSDWAQLESGTFRAGQRPFRDPLNKERRFLPLRLDDAPIKGSDWFRKNDDVRRQFGLPPKDNTNSAWVQHFIRGGQ